MDSYGKKCNSRFLLHYGFAVEVNREEDGKCQNEIMVEVGIDPKDKLFQTKVRCSFVNFYWLKSNYIHKI